jgi:bifunctional NMN adenylyltransferase/nudix hydrolase
MSKKYNTLVLIGRFQPVHNAHIEIIQRAKTLADKLVVIVGSAKQPRTYKNPFTAEERIEMLYAATRGIVDANFSISIEQNTDSMYNDQAWLARTQSLVAKHTKPRDRIGIIGHKKDASSFYLDMFPQWTFENVETIDPLNATDIRGCFFTRHLQSFIEGTVPQTTMDFLKEFKETEDFQQIIRERKFVEDYKKQYASLPYPPIFVTTDAVVVCSGHVLMIKRRSEPGRGLWALPGGFVNAETDKSVQDAAIRELREETGIKVPAPVLIGSIQDNRVFDAIGRSTRGRTITHAFKIVLPDGDLPKVKGADDAEKARWIPIAELDSSVCYEDHYEIMQYFVGA